MVNNRIELSVDDEVYELIKLISDDKRKSEYCRSKVAYYLFMWGFMWAFHCCGKNTFYPDNLNTNLERIKREGVDNPFLKGHVHNTLNEIKKMKGGFNG